MTSIVFFALIILVLAFIGFQVCAKWAVKIGQFVCKPFQKISKQVEEDEE